MTRLTFLLDTNVLSEPAKPDPDPGCLQRLHKEQDRVATTAITVHEMRYGLGRMPSGNRRLDLEAYLEQLLGSNIPVLAYDQDAALWHGRVRSEMESVGRPKPFVDGQIAAIAATQGLVLVTRNTSDFKEFPDISTENWFLDNMAGEQE